MIAKNLEEWHKLVCERDKYICQLQTDKNCKGDYSFDHYFNENGVNQYVCGDHLQTQGAHPDMRFDTKNGKCVCRGCHALRHKGIIPDNYLNPADEIILSVRIDKGEPSKFVAKNEPQQILTVNGVPLKGYEKLCKCKKYIAQEVSGVCMCCEKRGPSIFKSEKKKAKT